MGIFYHHEGQFVLRYDYSSAHQHHKFLSSLSIQSMPTSHNPRRTCVRCTCATGSAWRRTSRRVPDWFVQYEYVPDCRYHSSNCRWTTQTTETVHSRWGKAANCKRESASVRGRLVHRKLSSLSLGGYALIFRHHRTWSMRSISRKQKQRSRQDKAVHYNDESR